MSADLRIDFGFFTHRKTKKLIAVLGLQGAWSLLNLWARAAESRPKGKLHDMDEMDIALDAQWPGNPQEFCSALLQLHWLDRNGDGVYEIHDWEQHQGWVCHAPERSQRARENIEKRWGKVRAKKARKQGSIRSEYDSYSGSNTPSPSPSPSPLPSPRKDNTIPPIFESVKAYCEARKNTVDPQRFFDHYASRGWMIGKNKMKDWQAAVRTWEQNEANNPLPFNDPDKKLAAERAELMKQMKAEETQHARQT